MYSSDSNSKNDLWKFEPKLLNEYHKVKPMNQFKHRKPIYVTLLSKFRILSIWDDLK